MKPAHACLLLQINLLSNTVKRLQPLAGNMGYGLEKIFFAWLLFQQIRSSGLVAARNVKINKINKKKIACFRFLGALGAVLKYHHTDGKYTSNIIALPLVVASRGS